MKGDVIMKRKSKFYELNKGFSNIEEQDLDVKIELDRLKRIDGDQDYLDSVLIIDASYDYLKGQCKIMYAEAYKLKIENQKLRSEIKRLKKQLQEIES